MGIIPARAGFTTNVCLLEFVQGDHPRSRGVYSHKCGGLRGLVGSSPLARGLPCCKLAMLRMCGIIPARAGFTVAEVYAYKHKWDHPRSRGVYVQESWQHFAACGSSPLARGLLVRDLVIPEMLRIIPARAGFTRNFLRSVIPCQDHPRSRGVYDLT